MTPEHTQRVSFSSGRKQPKQLHILLVLVGNFSDFTLLFNQGYSDDTDILLCMSGMSGHFRSVMLLIHVILLFDSPHL